MSDVRISEPIDGTRWIYCGEGVHDMGVRVTPTGTVAPSLRHFLPTDIPNLIACLEAGADLSKIVALLSEVYEPEGVQIWLTSPHRWLGLERAVDLIADGRGGEALAAAERLVGGAW